MHNGKTYPKLDSGKRFGAVLPVPRLAAMVFLGGAQGDGPRLSSFCVIDGIPENTKP
jgi:hypothetical protein